MGRGLQTTAWVGHPSSPGQLASLSPGLLFCKMGVGAAWRHHGVRIKCENAKCFQQRLAHGAGSVNVCHGQMRRKFKFLILSSCFWPSVLPQYHTELVASSSWATPGGRCSPPASTCGYAGMSGGPAKGIALLLVRSSFPSIGSPSHTPSRFCLYLLTHPHTI